LSSSDVRDASAGVAHATGVVLITFAVRPKNFFHLGLVRQGGLRSQLAPRITPPRASRRTEPFRSSVGGGRAPGAPPRAMTRSGLLHRTPGDVVSSPRTSAPSAPIDASRVAHRSGSFAGPSPSRLALFVSPAASALAEAVAARVKLCAGLDCEWFTVHARAPEGVPRIDPAVLGADALAATLASSRWMAKENANPRLSASPREGGRGARSPAALIAKGEAAVRLGDHARANDAFAEARAANDAAVRGDARLRRAADADADAAAAVSPAHANARAVAAAFAPVVLAMLGDEPYATGGDRQQSASSRASSRADVADANLRCVLDVLAKGNSARGGLLIVLGTLPEATAAETRARCHGLGVAYVQCALVDFDAAHVARGAVDAWVASADGPRAMACAEAVVLRAVCGAVADAADADGEDSVVTIREPGGEADGDVGKDAEEEMEEEGAGKAQAQAHSHSKGSFKGSFKVRRLASGDPRDAASPRAAVLASLLAAQAAEIRSLQASAATAAEARAMRTLRDDAEAAAKDAARRAASETDRASFLELALTQERRARSSALETLEHAHKARLTELERDHARDRERFAEAEETLRAERDACARDADEARARLESRAREFSAERELLRAEREEERGARAELERLEVAYDRLAVEKRAEAERMSSRAEALRDALGASRAETADLAELLSAEKGGRDARPHLEDAFFARDRAEADATETRGKLAEATTEARRWRARCDAAERRALDAERRAEKDAMRAVVADARAASFRDAAAGRVPDTYGHSVSRDALERVGAAPENAEGSAAPTETERPRGVARTSGAFDVVSSSDVVHPALVETPGPGIGATPGPAAPRYLPAPAFLNLETPEGTSAERGPETFGPETFGPETFGPETFEPETFGPEPEPESERERDLASALSRADAAEEKLRACESALRLAETAKADAETRAAAATILAESDRRETGDFEATVSGLKRAILEARAETRVAARTAETETKTARASVAAAEAAAHALVASETKRRVAAERERDAAREEAASARKNADATRAEAERLLERAEISPTVTDEEETHYVSRIGDDAKTAKTKTHMGISSVSSVCSEREAVSFAAARCAELERLIPGARVCVARVTEKKKLAVVAAGAMAPLVRWFGARGWSSKVARGSLAHACLSAATEARAENGAFAGRRRRVAGGGVRRVATAGGNPEDEHDASVALLRQISSVRARGDGANGAGVAVACGSLGDLALLVDCSDRLARVSLADLKNAHVTADAVAAAFDRADDAADAAAIAAFAASRDALENSDENSEQNKSFRDAFDSAAHAVRAMETHAARRHRAESMCRRRYRGGDGCLTRVVDAGAGALFAFIHDDGREDGRFEDTIAPNCAAIAAAVLAHVARAAGVAAGVGGSAAIPRAARDAFAALSEAAAAVEAAEKEDALEIELEQAMGIRRRPKRSVLKPDEACRTTLSSGESDAETFETFETFETAARRRFDSAALAAARTAAPLWSAPKSETPKTKTPSAFAVARLLVRGEDGHDKMRDRAVDANLGPERDLDDVEKTLRLSSAPLAFALAAIRRGASEDSERVFDADAVVALRAAHALWLWTASCVALWRARRLVRATARPGVFDVESVEAELRRRRRAASVVGRYWRAHAERFFANARAARPFSVDRA
jgi:hypothetical protein